MIVGVAITAWAEGRAKSMMSAMRMDSEKNLLLIIGLPPFSSLLWVRSPPVGLLPLVESVDG